jgi:hypothetical protein
MAETAAHLVDYVLPVVPIRQWVLSLPHALRTMLGYDPELLGVALQVFMRAVSGWIRGKVREKVGLIDARDVHFGAVTFVQRFGDALDLNPHFHALVLDGAYVVRHGRFEGFVQIEPPSDDDVAGIVMQVAQRVERMLRRRGKIEDDAVAQVEDDGSVLLPCMAASVQRIGVMGEGSGRTLRRPGRRRDVEVVRVAKRRCAEVDGFSLHADVCVPARDRSQLERLCRYVARPAIASERLELLPDGRVRYRFKRVWRDGSVAVELDPIDFVGKLAALVPRPRSNLVRYHGCLAPHASIRAYVVKDGRGPPPSKAEVAAIAAARGSMPVESRAALSCAPVRERGLRWPQLMQRVFSIDVLRCPSCGGRMKAIAEITDKRVARAMLEHVGLPSDAPEQWPARGPPEWVGSVGGLDDEQRAPDDVADPATDLE